MNSSKRKYPKSFYDDGLGDFLDWIDDEVLVHSEDRSSSKKAKSKQPEHDGSKSDTKKTKKDAKLYGENDVEKVLQKSKRTKTDRPPDEVKTNETTSVNKNVEDRTRGLINRLAAQTMPFVSGEFQKLYSTYSRTELNAALVNHINNSLIDRSAVAKRKLVAELMLLISFLDSKISHNIGATIVHELINQFERLYSNGTADEDKRLDNVVFCLVNLYTTGLLSANIMFELTKRICSPEDFRPKSIELLLIVLKNIGFQLRKDNPGMMRQLILMSHEQCKQLKSNQELEARIEFIVEALGAIKNNNVNKIGNYGCDIDKETIESTLKRMLARTRLPESLADATYDEIANSCNWYLLETRMGQVDGPMEGSEEQSKQTDKKSQLNNKTERKLCKALGLNKPAEKTILGALIKVSDFVEASNIVISNGLNYCSDAMVVIMQVAIYEKTYNQFYYNVINNLCKFNRRYKMAAKFAMQDKIRTLSGMSSQRVNILSRLCLDLIQSDAMPITVLKAIEWASLDTSTKQFLSHLLEAISDLPEAQKQQIMLKADRKSSFAGAMRTYTNCFLKGCILFE